MFSFGPATYTGTAGVRSSWRALPSQIAAGPSTAGRRLRGSAGAVECRSEAKACSEATKTRFDAIQEASSSFEAAGAHVSELSRRTAILAALAASVAVLPASRPAFATPEDLDSILSARAKLDLIPPLIKAEKWDDIRNILAPKPVGKLQNYMTAVASGLKGDALIADAFDEVEETANALQDIDTATYLLVFAVSDSAKEKNVNSQLEALRRTTESLDRFLALLPADDLRDARARAAK